MSKWHQWGARFSEWALYGLLLAQPLTGMAATILGGRPFNVFGLEVPSLLPPNTAWSATFQGLHSVGAYALASLVLVHAVAAILHRVIANDGVLDSILPLRRDEARVSRYAELDVHSRWRSLPAGRPPAKRG
jgi:cytochrome b561